MIIKIIGAFLTLFLAVSAQARDYAFSVIDTDGEPIANALIMLDGEFSGEASEQHAIMDQIDQAFVPRVLAVTKDTVVDFPNSDDIRHHVYSFSPAKTFELKLYEKKPDNPITFDEPGIVVLGCNIHDQMIGYIAVSDTPHYALTDDQGKATISAPDTQSARVWHESMAVNQHKVKRLTLTDTNERGEYVLTVANQATTSPQPSEQEAPGFNNQRFQQYGD